MRARTLGSYIGLGNYIGAGGGGGVGVAGWDPVERFGFIVPIYLSTLKVQIDYSKGKLFL